jgi:hypothetical protein
LGDFIRRVSDRKRCNAKAAEFEKSLLPVLKVLKDWTPGGHDQLEGFKQLESLQAPLKDDTLDVKLLSNYQLLRLMTYLLDLWDLVLKLPIIRSHSDEDSSKNALLVFRTVVNVMHRPEFKMERCVWRALLAGGICNAYE